MIWVALKSRWFWFLYTVVLLTSVSITMMPMSARSTLCAIYQEIRPFVLQIISEEDATSSAPAATAPVSSRVVERLDTLLCPGAADSTSQLSAQSFAGLLGGAFPIAIAIYLLVPPRPGVDRVVAEHDAVAAANPRVDDKLTLSLYVNTLAIRAAVFRCVILYALMSGLVTALVHPDLPLAGLSESMRRVLHVAALTLCAAGVGGWCCSRPAIRLPEMSAMALAWRIGFGGTLLSGVVALSISLPYRVVSDGPGARLAAELVLLIVGVRLALIPTAAFLAGWLTIGLTRAARQMPAKWVS